MAASRKMVEGIYGGHQPRDVASAVALGILAGALAGGNVSFLPVLLAAILFNVHTRLFLAAWLASVLLAWLSRGWLDTLGQFLLDGTHLGRAVGLLGDGPLIALLGWDEYALVGGLAAAATAAVACAPIAYWITCRLQETWQPTGANLPGGEPTPEGPRAKVRPLVRVWYGPSNRERGVRQTMGSRRLRPLGVPATLAAAITMAVASWSLARFSAERELWRQLSRYNGAEVSCADTQLSLLSGDFLVRDLQIADAGRLDRDRFRIGVAKGRLSPGLLLRGRLNVERLVLAQVRADTQRQQAAQPCTISGVDQTVAVDRSLRTPTPSAGDLDVSRYVRPWRSVCRRLGDLQQLVAAVERLPSAETIGDSEGRRRSDLGRPRPKVMVHELRVDGLPRTWNLGGKALIEVVHLSSNPSPADKPAQARIVLPKFGAEVQLDFASDENHSHSLRCWACDVELGEWIDAPLAVSGSARLAVQGSFDRQQLDVRVFAEVEALTAEVTKREPLMGVEPELWNRGCRRLAACNAEIVCCGPWTSPGLMIDSRGLVEQFKGRLRAAGEGDLAATIEQQIALHLASQAGLQEEVPAAPSVVQATAIETQTAGVETQPPAVEAQTAGIQAPASRSGLREFSTEDERQAPSHAEAPGPTEPDSSSYSNFSYPTTSVPYDDARYASGPASLDFEESEPVSPALPPYTSPGDRNPVRQRPLPGPVQMVLGHDRYTAPRTSLVPFGGAPERQEGRWTRWTQGLRQKFAQAFAKPESEAADPPEPAPAGSSAGDDDRAIPAAASEAWYNRRWR